MKSPDGLLADELLAKRIRCITFCTLFLDYPAVVEAMIKMEQSPDAPQKAAEYVNEYARSYIRDAAAFLVKSGYISERVADHWRSISNAQDFHVEPLFDVPTNIVIRSLRDDSPAIRRIYRIKNKQIEMKISDDVRRALHVNNLREH